MRGGQYDFESFASSLITPPNFGSGGGSCFPSIVVVALGEPGVPGGLDLCSGGRRSRHDGGSEHPAKNDLSC